MIKQSFPLKTTDEIKMTIILPARLSDVQTILNLVLYKK